ncbi:hypothetical protein ASE01_01855 [Nocardioides sp. Root190]|uniref:lytic transglycosylase domain-containing protein n=1 Tax=Nocardioides sp. Root190 TaxID=1736488 RepID=UPI0006F9BC2D|nr:lytic transglycosylase domain-containing protein [Nocardioides sp. Root190]KRB80261.1 hypothetical protein ASE01_01855 [Nocardioides sp. Root190]
MSRKRLGRLQRVATIIPLALLSAAWTASVAGIGGVTAPVLAAEGPGQVSDGTSVPEESIEDPASLSDPATVQGLSDGNDAAIVNAATTNAIPAAALAAYQRAETVINSADKSCNITWQLIAAIGRVESNHGRFGGNVLNDDGVATPGIYGIALDGTNNTKAISDTDAGVYDNDTQWDRAVGPMQFIPSTWQVVGVDADDDAARNPQDIDDAALAAAVYLCSGDGDLSAVAGQRSAIFRYNHSDAYVDLVLKVMNAYLEGDFTSVPNNSTAAGYVVPEPPSFNVKGPKGTKGPGSGGGGSTDGGTTDGGGSTGGGTGGGDGGTGGGDGGTGGGDTPTTPKPPGKAGGGLTTGGGALDPDSDEPITGIAPVDTLVKGLAGAIKPIEVTLKCALWSLTQPNAFTANKECVASYK